jgi:hypothetical protein
MKMDELMTVALIENISYFLLCQILIRLHIDININIIIIKIIVISSIKVLSEK